MYEFDTASGNRYVTMRHQEEKRGKIWISECSLAREEHWGEPCEPVDKHLACQNCQWKDEWLIWHSCRPRGPHPPKYQQGTVVPCWYAEARPDPVFKCAAPRNNESNTGECWMLHEPQEDIEDYLKSHWSDMTDKDGFFVVMGVLSYSFLFCGLFSFRTGIKRNGGCPGRKVHPNVDDQE
eukprot:gnl/TRDRNA2_/TRDRNA2_163683_c0_seq4.p1 gnl/TRDRNA2_/TRDRNA2_163683_c0~~gnl/TRDRNA2_/TRDRNA2_163683_c0_seq4.p1  ORF type:complete len:180 (-),score=3.40 gnl/TRDRNA2_/TRDRNA2_163683_c0_seq4:309-848(-)